jgi:uncharacterized membrane protein
MPRAHVHETITMTDKPASQESINDREWADPRNWDGWLGSYRSEADSLTWVPKRNPRLGWTLNFAHASAWWSLTGLLIVPLGFLLFLVIVTTSAP